MLYFIQTKWITTIPRILIRWKIQVRIKLSLKTFLLIIRESETALLALNNSNVSNKILGRLGGEGYGSRIQLSKLGFGQDIWENCDGTCNDFKHLRPIIWPAKENSEEFRGVSGCGEADKNFNVELSHFLPSTLYSLTVELTCACMCVSV